MADGTIQVMAGVMLGVLAASAPILAWADDRASPVEFVINGEAVTQAFIQAGLNEANTVAPEVCPVEPTEAWGIRRNRLIQLMPIRQFLKKESVAVEESEIEKRLKAMQQVPNPFGRFPPRRLEAVMVKECLSWDDVRLLIQVEIGLNRWAERQWEKAWPTEAAWTAHCRNERKAFEKRYVKVRRMSFPIDRWPAGAKNETEAMARLREQAEQAKHKLDNGSDFSELAGQVAAKSDQSADAAPALIWALDRFNDESAAILRDLPSGTVSPVLSVPLGWEIYKTAPMTDADVSETLKDEYIVRAQLEIREKLMREAKIEKGDWTDLEKETMGSAW